MRSLAHNVRHPSQVVMRMLENLASLTGIVLIALVDSAARLPHTLAHLHG